MPTKPTGDGAKSVSSQRDMRFVDTFHDQHRSVRFPEGRPWCGYRERAANPDLGDLPGFCTPELQKGDHRDPFRTNWDAPWVPEFNGGQNQYYMFDFEHRKIQIRYDRVIAHDTLELDKYYRAAAALAAANGWGAIEYGKMPSFQITSQIGTPPRSPKIAQAAQAGDPWLLGFTDEPNVELAKLLGITVSGMRIATPEPAAPPPIKVDQVLASSPEQLIALIASVVGQTLDAREAAKKQGKRDAMAHARAARHTKPAPAESDAA